MSGQRDIECMSYALRLAKYGIYTTWPNPNVGCVITNQQGEIVGEGYHVEAGGPHAEIIALQQAGDKAKHGTAYVTLEPCCHHGKTGPCTQAFINARIQRVVVAMHDPNPLVAGKGIDELKQHGIIVNDDIMKDQAIALNRGFVKRMTVKLPWVTLKIASSSDGRTALNNGQSQWITSDAARQDVQKIRARHDAIVTGIGTILADDPSMNVRIDPARLGVKDQVRQPLRVIIDPCLKTPIDAKIFTSSGKTMIFSNQSAHSNKLNDLANCEIITLASGQGRLDLKQVLEYLASIEINNVIIEAGASLLGSFIDARLVDELIHYVAPTLMGDLSRGMMAIHEITSMDKCINLEFQDIRQIGKDLRIISLIQY